MNQTQNNNSNSLTMDEISKLHGDDLKKALDQRLQSHKNEVDEVDALTKDACDEVEKMPDIDEKKAEKEDRDAVAEIEKSLDDDLKNAVLDLATEDEILKDIEDEPEDSDEPADSVE